MFLVLQIEWDDLGEKLVRLEKECKHSWDNLRAIVKHDSNITMKVRMTDFLSDTAERIIILKIVHKRVINRYV